MPSPAARAGRLAGEVLARVGNQLTGARFAEQAERSGAVPSDGIAVYFGTGPENVYQFAQWRRPLEHLARQRPVFVVVDRPDTGRLVVQQTTLPVTLQRSSAQLERLVAERRVRLVLYPNQVEQNFRMLRFAAPVHVQIGHGESDKGGSVSNQHKAYDVTFVGGPAGRDRLGRALRWFDAGARTRLVGRPQLDHDYPGAPAWAPGDGTRVWYAPTWEGDRPSIAYGSLVSHGPAIVDALLADRDARVIYRPHPRTGTASAAAARADRAIRDRLRSGGSRHLVDTGEYGWQWRFADACVTDLSAVAYDWLATGKPLVVTEPADRRAYLPTTQLTERLPLLPARQSGAVLSWLGDRGLGGAPDEALIGLAAYYFSEVTPGAGTRRFEAAVDELRATG